MRLAMGSSSKSPSSASPVRARDHVNSALCKALSGSAGRQLGLARNEGVRKKTCPAAGAERLHDVDCFLSQVVDPDFDRASRLCFPCQRAGPPLTGDGRSLQHHGAGGRVPRCRMQPELNGNGQFHRRGDFRNTLDKVIRDFFAIHQIDGAFVPDRFAKHRERIEAFGEPLRTARADFTSITA
jgi:hypothetical protein